VVTTNEVLQRSPREKIKRGLFSTENMLFKQAVVEVKILLLFFSLSKQGYSH
jgi:hypothetical protein